MFTLAYCFGEFDYYFWYRDCLFLECPLEEVWKPAYLYTHTTPSSSSSVAFSFLAACTFHLRRSLSLLVEGDVEGQVKSHEKVSMLLSTSRNSK